MCNWLKAGAEIPDDSEVEVDLTGVQYDYSPKQQVRLEKKEDRKVRGMRRPTLSTLLRCHLL
jgi:hypothetical protein